METLFRTLSNDLDKLNILFAVNKLYLNVSKTNLILFGLEKVQWDINITIDDVIIEEFISPIILGVMIDSKLNWKEHIYIINNLISKNF